MRAPNSRLNLRLQAVVGSVDLGVSNRPRDNERKSLLRKATGHDLNTQGQLSDHQDLRRICIVSSYVSKDATAEELI